MELWNWTMGLLLGFLVSVSLFQASSTLFILLMLCSSYSFPLCSFPSSFCPKFFSCFSPISFYFRLLLPLIGLQLNEWEYIYFYEKSCFSLSKYFYERNGNNEETKNLISHLRGYSERGGNFVSAKPSTWIFKREQRIEVSPLSLSRSLSQSNEVNLCNSTIMFKQLRSDMQGNWTPSLMNMADFEYYVQVILNVSVVSAENALTSDVISGWGGYFCPFASYCILYITVVIISA